MSSTTNPQNDIGVGACNDHKFTKEPTRALVRYEGQSLPATVRATDRMLDERMVAVDFDRHSNTVMKAIGGVVAILDDLVDLGVDQEGARHLWSPESNLVWAVERVGTVRWSYDLDDLAGADIRTWTRYVARERGWTKED